VIRGLSSGTERFRHLNDPSSIEAPRPEFTIPGTSSDPPVTKAVTFETLESQDFGDRNVLIASDAIRATDIKSALLAPSRAWMDIPCTTLPM